jgi:hypothetical protein
MGGVVGLSGRSGSGGTFIGINVQSINTTSLVTSVPLFIAGGAGGVGLNGGLQSASASLTTTGKNGYNGASGRIGPNSGNNGTGYGGGGFNDFKNYGGTGTTGGAFGLGGNKGADNASGGGGGGYGGGGGGGGVQGGSGGGGGLYDITNLFNCSVANSSQGYFRIDTGIRFTLSNPGNIFLITGTSSASSILLLTYTTPNPYGFIPSNTCVPTPDGITVTSSLNDITLTAAQGTTLATTSVTVTASYGAFSYPVTFSLTCGPTIGLVLQNPGASTIYINFTNSYILISLTNTYNLPVTWAITSTPITGIATTTTNTSMIITYNGITTFPTQTMTVQVTYGSFTTSTSFTIGSSSQTAPALQPCANNTGATVPNVQRMSGMYVFNNTSSRLAFDNRDTVTSGMAVPLLFPTLSLFAYVGDSITAIFRIVSTSQTYNYLSAYIYDGTGWNYNPLLPPRTINLVGTTDYTHTFTMPALSPGFYTLLFMSTYDSQLLPTNGNDIRRTALEYTLRILP